MGMERRVEVRSGLVALAIVIVVAVLLFALFRLPFTIPAVLAVWLGATSLTAFAYYGYDKAQARSRRARIPEAVLHGLALAGGTPGAYLGMVLFRHKTIKPSFRILFWVIAVLQVLLVIALVYRLWWRGESGTP